MNKIYFWQFSGRDRRGKMGLYGKGNVRLFPPPKVDLERLLKSDDALDVFELDAIIRLEIGGISNL